MIWNDHSKDIPEGTHAFLGASQYHWLNYDEEKLITVYKNFLATLKGTELHAFAAQCIRLKQKLPDEQKTLNMYVNDAIDIGMYPEQPLKYSEFCFGTADSILLDDMGILRVHDYKSGVTKANMKQLFIYVALYCLEYDFTPRDFTAIETRIYQNDDIVVNHPGLDIIVPIMDKIISFDRILREIKEGEK